MFLFFSLLLAFNGCTSTTELQPGSSKYHSPVVWKWERSKKGFYSNSFVYRNMLITGMQSHADSSRGFSLVALTTDSGKLVWQNNDFHYRFDPFATEDVAMKENVVVLSEAYRIYAVDALSGQMLWKDEIDHGSYNIAIIDNWVYKNTEKDRRESSLFRYDLYTGKKEHVITLHKDSHGSGFSPGICMPVKWVHPSGDEILIFQNRTFGWYTTNESKMDIVAYNLTADSIMWYLDGLDNTSSASKPQIEENRVYFYGSYYVWCLDAATGTVIWHFKSEDPHGDFNTANILIADHLLIVKPESRWMYGIDKLTGRKWWLNKNTRASPHLLQEHNDTVWFASNGIQGVSINNGSRFINWKGSSGWWSAPVTPHPANGTIFTTDGNYIYCIDPDYLPRVKE